jgi:hypothetical protein
MNTTSASPALAVLAILFGLMSLVAAPVFLIAGAPFLALLPAVAVVSSVAALVSARRSTHPRSRQPQVTTTGVALGALSAVLYAGIAINQAPIWFGIGDDDNAWSLSEMRTARLERVDELPTGTCVAVRYRERGAPPSRYVRPMDCAAQDHNARVTGTHLLDARSHPDTAALVRQAASLCSADVERDRSDVLHSEGPDGLLDSVDGFIYWIPTADELERGVRYVVCAVENNASGEFDPPNYDYEQAAAFACGHDRDAVLRSATPGSGARVNHLGGLGAGDAIAAACRPVAAMA